MTDLAAIIKEPVHSQLDKAGSYAEWLVQARSQDKLNGKLAWRMTDYSRDFDYRSIRRRLEQLRLLRATGDDRGLLFTLNEGIHGNLDGMANERLWREALTGTKEVITDYVEAVVEAIRHLASDAVDSIPDEEKRDFFQRCLHCFGSSALLLSGSGAFLYFHIGVVRAMAEQGLLPDIIAGSSGGAIVGAIVCTHSDGELATMLCSHEISRLLAGDALTGQAHGGQTQDDVLATISALIPDVTFQEAFAMTRRHLNVSVAPAERHQNSRMLNAITSPNVFIREAVLASCAVPGVFPPVLLMAKDATGARVPYLPSRRWVDGSVTHDLPTKRLSRLYGVNHHIVSQANPMAMPFASETKLDGSPLRVLRQASLEAAKALMNVQMTLWERPMAIFPPLHKLATMTQSVLNQEYSGDINIVRPIMLWSPSKLLTTPSLEEMTELIEIGERRTWRKMEMIRVQTLISRTLAEILQEREATPSVSALVSAKRQPN